MFAVDFEFNGIKMSDLGWRIVNIGQINDGEVPAGGEVTFTTSKAINGMRWNYNGAKYETPYSFTCQICKFNEDCQMVNIGNREQAFIHKLLVRKDGYRWFRWLTDGYENVYYNAQIALQWYKVASDVIGATLTITCDAPWGYSPVHTYEKTISSGQTFTIYNDSDDIGAIIPSQMEILIKSNGNLRLSNSLETLYSPTYPSMKIDNCVSGEVIVINGITKQISTNKSSHKVANDYNYKPIRLINLDENYTYNSSNATMTSINDLRSNNITASGCDCTINLAYRTIRKVVI